MTHGPIRSRDELARLGGGAIAESFIVQPLPDAADAPVAEEPERVWEIPPPSNGMWYTREDVARILGVGVSRVDQLSNYGVKTERGEVVKLAKQVCPRGAIVPCHLCEFLSKMSGVKVVIWDVKPNQKVEETTSDGKDRETGRGSEAGGS